MNTAVAQRTDLLTVDDFTSLPHLMPETARLLAGCMGVEAAVDLLNTWPGVEVKVPRFPDANPAGAKRWAQMASVVGEPAMRKLAALYGGTVLEIPLCSRVQQEKRNRIIRQDFDRITSKPPAGPGLSKAEAVQEIGMRYAPISVRQIKSILNQINR